MEITGSTRIFITGCGGMLGKAVYEKFSANAQVLATDIDLNEPWLEYADVLNFEKTAQIANRFRPDIVINLAALTDLEYCENNPDHAWKTNALGAENIALIAKRLNALHIYISTAGIFDGRQEFYTDFDQPNPLSMYAKAKYYGEKAVERMLDKYFVFRAGWMMGGGPQKDKKFINKIYKQIAAGATELNVVVDKLGTPTYTANFADSMFKVIRSDLYGLYNMVCSGSCSRYDVAVEFVKQLGLSDRIKIKVVDSGYFQKEYFAPRPASEKLVNLKLESRGINYMINWRDCLQDYSPVFKNNLETLTQKAIALKEMVAV
jgi:dTDP-4-dehydrorhamnose reductase